MLTEETRHYVITTTTLPDGGHWRSMPGQDASEHLQDVLDDMAALIRVGRAQEGDNDVARLELDPDDFDRVAGRIDAVDDWLAAWSLDTRVARWSGDSTLARVQFAITLGGPSVFVNVLCNSEGGVERVLLERYWSGSDCAWTTDGRACAVVDEFLTLAIGE